MRDGWHNAALLLPIYCASWADQQCNSEQLAVKITYIWYRLIQTKGGIKGIFLFLCGSSVCRSPSTCSSVTVPKAGTRAKLESVKGEEALVSFLQQKWNEMHWQDSHVNELHLIVFVVIFGGIRNKYLNFQTFIYCFMLSDIFHISERTYHLPSIFLATVLTSWLPMVFWIFFIFIFNWWENVLCCVRC